MNITLIGLQLYLFWFFFLCCYCLKNTLKEHVRFEIERLFFQMNSYFVFNFKIAFHLFDVFRSFHDFIDH